MLIYFGHKLGQLRNGVQNTPKYFKKFFDSNKSYDVICNNSDSNRYVNMIENLQNLYYSNSRFSETKINIGGDHSMALATVAESLNRYDTDELKVVWFDAHPDINTFEASESKNFHGMPLSYLTGLNNNPDFSFIMNKLSFNNLLYIGIRDIDDFEKKVIEDKNIEYISCDEINNEPDISLDKICNFIGNSPVHLSFDVDSMDPKIIPCTGTTFGNGLNFNTKKILDELYNSNIVNIDITEINLELGNQYEKDLTITNTLHLFDKYFDKYLIKR